MFDIECPNPAYNRLKESGIFDRIIDKKEIISEIFTYKYPFIEETEGERILEKAEEEAFVFDKKVDGEEKVLREVLELFCELEEEGRAYHDNSGEIYSKYPSFLAYLVLGDKLFNYYDYGFPSRESLEESITSFCVGENEQLRYEDHVIWRTKNLKHILYRDLHGDMYASMCDVSGKDFKENTLFGEIDVFDTIKKEVKHTGISSYQDWSSYLISTLKFAQALGKADMSEIVNWKEIRKIEGYAGTNTTECESGSNHSMLEFMMNSQVANAKWKDIGKSLIRARFGENEFLSYIEENNNDKKLLYLYEDEDGEFSPEGFDKNFRKELEYYEEDIPHILKASYKYFSRDPSKVPVIMNWFLEENGLKNT